MISKVAGDNQTAPPGSLLPISPTVQIRNASGTPIASVDVTFTVSLGGGAVQNASARTDATGTASCGGWTLGPGRGFHGLTVSVQGASSVTFEAVAATTSPDVTVTVTNPRATTLVNGQFGVNASLTATFQITSVIASFGTAQATLTGSFGSYSGVMVPGDQSRGTHALIVSATDVFGHSTDAVIPLVFDRKPTLVVSEPVEGSLARPTLHVSATCTDDDSAGCQWVAVYANSITIANPATSFTGDVDLSAYEGSRLTLQVTGVDSAGQVTNVFRTVYVESSPRLGVRAEVAGTPWDARDTRILFVDDAGVLTMSDTNTGLTQTLDSHPELTARWGSDQGVIGYLTQSGAIWAHPLESNLFDCPVEQWQSGATLQVSPHGRCGSLRVAGNWAVFNGPTFPAFRTSDATRCDLVSGTSELVTPTAWNGTLTSLDVAANGDVAFPDASHGIYLWRSGTASLLGEGSGGYVVTDGVHYVYSGPQGLTMSDGTRETPLGSAARCGCDTFDGLPASLPNRCGCSVAGGYVAFLAQDAAGTSQVWRLGPAGTEQVTFFFASSLIDAITPDGTIAFTNAGRRYRASLGAAPVGIGSALGRMEVRDGRFVLLLGRAVLDVLP